jgi:hypothetical protein
MSTPKTSTKLTPAQSIGFICILKVYIAIKVQGLAGKLEVTPLDDIPHAK